MGNDNDVRLKTLSSVMRRNMTPEERHLWYDFLVRLPITVRRQKVFGSYIVDFYIPETKTVIEIDGIQHQTEENRDYDMRRDAYLNSLGLSVLRYPNYHIRRRFSYVSGDILDHLGLTQDDLIDSKTEQKK